MTYTTEDMFAPTPEPEVRPDPFAHYSESDTMSATLPPWHFYRMTADVYFPALFQLMEENLNKGEDTWRSEIASNIIASDRGTSNKNASNSNGSEADASDARISNAGASDTSVADKNIVSNAGSKTPKIMPEYMASQGPINKTNVMPGSIDCLV
ncbi:hypothetical protein Dda_7117 [Drechslerella dactyloides]|uniref:Uncharacterized protein n=1 Tax=Drechslerella dactyloides TaxID=74499 RepID=A0AAD6IT58_DREDA|nr:hypothetical protein Dda_7117 [Drechslerella dactyloides]